MVAVLEKHAVLASRSHRWETILDVAAKAKPRALRIHGTIGLDAEITSYILRAK